MFNSNRVIAVVSRNGQVARVSYDPKNLKGSKKFLGGEVEMASAQAVMEMVELTLEQAKENNFEGRITFIVNDDVAIKYYGYTKAIAKGEDPLESITFEWMEPEVIEAIEKFVLALESVPSNIELNFVKLSSLYRWELKVQEGVELKEGMELIFNDGVAMDGMVSASNNKLSGKHIVALHNDRFVVPRNTTSMVIQTAKKAVEYAWSKCPVQTFEEDVEVCEGF